MGELRRLLGLSAHVVAELLQAPSGAVIRQLERCDEVLLIGEQARWHTALIRASADTAVHTELDELEAEARDHAASPEGMAL
jgi:hypothetical protein